MIDWSLSTLMEDSYQCFSRKNHKNKMILCIKFPKFEKTEYSLSVMNTLIKYNESDVHTVSC